MALRQLRCLPAVEVGPTTPEGRKKSSLNRLSHGFASNTRFIKGEDPEEFYALLNDSTSEYHPATPTEQVLVERMAHNQWVSLRAIRIQGDLLGRMTVVSDVRYNLPLLIRYQTTADRAFHKAHAELVKAQKQRGTSKIGFESKNADKPATSPAETPEKPPVVIEKPAPEAPQGGITRRFASDEEEMEWIMNCSFEEMKAVGL